MRSLQNRRRVFFRERRRQAAALYHDYSIIPEDLLHEQRGTLKILNKIEGVHDNIIRLQLELLDLEEEKVCQH